MKDDIFSVEDYDIMQGDDGAIYARVTWKCSLCHKKFVMYDPPEDHRKECLAYLVSKI